MASNSSLNCSCSSRLGRTVTRGGLPVLEIPSFCLTASEWGPIPTTQISTSVFTAAAQTNELPGHLWGASFTLPHFVGQPEKLGELRAFFMKLRGAAGRFFAYDPSWRDNLGVLGKAESASVTRVLPEITGNDTPLYPALDLYPSDTLFPSDGNYPEYTFSLSLSFDADADLIITQAADNGATTITVNPISITSTGVVNDNPWEYSNGVRPGYEEALQWLTNHLEKRIDLTPESSLLMPGDYIQIDDHLAMVVEPFEVGDTTITFEPPLVHPVAANTAVEYKEPGVVMRLVDDAQSRWSARLSSTAHHAPITFQAVQVL